MPCRRGEKKAVTWPRNSSPAAIREWLCKQREMMTREEVAEWDTAGAYIAEILQRHGFDPVTKRPYAGSLPLSISNLE
jgi:hypothetical protein